MSRESERNIQNEELVFPNGSENGTSQTMSTFEPLPELHTPHKKRKTILWLGVVLAVLDLCCLPITYYYALNFDTNLKLQDGTVMSLYFINHQADGSQYLRS